MPFLNPCIPFFRSRIQLCSFTIPNLAIRSIEIIQFKKQSNSQIESTREVNLKNRKWFMNMKDYLGKFHTVRVSKKLFMYENFEIDTF